MHNEAGYAYIGGNSFYKLTLPEIKRLQLGFEVTQEKKKEQQEEEHPELRSNSNQVRDSDKKALKDFKAKHNLS